MRPSVLNEAEKYELSDVDDQIVHAVNSVIFYLFAHTHHHFYSDSVFRIVIKH